MASILATTVVARAKTTLQDETNIRWTDGELLNNLNDGQRHIVSIKPDAYAKNSVITLVAGTKQSIPADAVKLIRAVRNMGTNGTTPGRAIYKGDLDIIDRTDPEWHTSTAAAEVKNYFFEKENHRDFYVSPPQPVSGFGQIEIIYSASPSDATINGVNNGVADSTITLDDIYFDPIYFYILFKAHSKETKEAKAERGMKYYNLMLQSLGMKSDAEAMLEPEVRQI